MSVPIDHGVKKRYEAVLFDLDGTLYDKRFLIPLLGLSCVSNIRCLAALFSARKSKAGIDFGGRDALLTALALDASLRMNGSDPDYIRSWYEEGLYGAYVELMRRFYRPRPCFKALLVKADKGSPRYGLISDYSYIDDRLLALGLKPDLFSIRISCEDEGALKPAPRPFLNAAFALAVEPSRILVVGDSKDSDGAGAAAAGMDFYRVATAWEGRHLAASLNTGL